MSFLALFLILIPFVAFPDITDQIPTETWLGQVFQFFATFQGKSTLVLVVGVTQLLMIGFQTPLAQFAGKYRLLVVSLLSFIGVVVGAMVTGLSVSGALGAAPALAAFQVFISQLWKQFFTEKGNVQNVLGGPVGK